jgi:hypothetical protein
MKKILLRRMAAVLFSFAVPHSLFACFAYTAFSATASGNCSVNVAWTFQECQEPGTYYIEASADNGSTWYIVNSVATGAPTDTRSYTYTDNYAHPPGSGSATVEYRVVFTSIYVVNPAYSSITSVSLGASSCSNACSGVPSNLSITGPVDLCNGHNASFGLSSTYPVIFNVTSGAGFVSLSQTVGGSTASVTNNNTDGQYMTLEVNVYGCKTVTDVVALGVPPNMSYSISPSQDPFCTGSINSATLNPIDPAVYTADIGFEWGYVDQTQLTGPFVVNSNGGITQDYTPYITAPDVYQLYARALNSCGYFQGNTVTLDIQASDQCGGGGLSTARQGLTGKSSLFGPDNDHLTVFPNPTSGLVTIQLPDSFNIERTFIRVMDVMGRPLQIKAAGSYTPALNLSKWGKGIYFVEIYDDKRSFIRKVVVSL